MGIFSRLNTVLRSNLNALIDKAEDPEKLIGQTIEDMQAETKRARRELVSTLGTAKRLAKKHEELKEEAVKWEDKAVLALQEGDEELAREALRRKARTLKEAEQVKQQSAHQEAAAEEMKSTLERIEDKIEDLRARKTTLAAQVRKAREAPAATASTGSTSRFGSDTFDELERMGSRIDQLDAEVEAAEVLDDGRVEVDARFRELEKSTEASAVDDELAALKRKLGG